MTDAARSVAFDPRAPADERADAMAELQKSAMPRALSDLIPASNIQPVIDYINRRKNTPSRAPQGPQERTLDTAAIRIAGAPNGTRNQTLYRVASAVAAQVRAGQIQQDEAERQLHLAGLAAGLEEHEIRASIRSAMRHAK